MSDISGHDATRRDALHTLTVRDLEAAIAKAGVLMSRRQLVRHCKAGTFDAAKLMLARGDIRDIIAGGAESLKPLLRRLIEAASSPRDGGKR